MTLRICMDGSLYLSFGRIYFDFVELIDKLRERQLGSLDYSLIGLRREIR